MLTTEPEEIPTKRVRKLKVIEVKPRRKVNLMLMRNRMEVNKSLKVAIIGDDKW